MSRRLGTRSLLAVLLTALVAACSSGADDADDGAVPDDGPAVVDADEGIAGVVAIRIASADHTDAAVDYDRSPPAGGDHNPSPVRCGFYDEEIPSELIVHSMEHGAVWLAYAPTLAPTDVDALHELARGNEEVVVTPYPDLDEGVAVVASAWARQLVLDSVTDPRLEAFVARYQDGGQAPEAAVPCASSPVGEPIP